MVVEVDPEGSRYIFKSYARVVITAGRCSYRRRSRFRAVGNSLGEGPRGLALQQ